MPNYVFLTDANFDADGIRSDDVHFRIGRLIEDTMVFAEAYKQAWKNQEANYGFQIKPRADFDPDFRYEKPLTAQLGEGLFAGGQRGTRTPGLYDVSVAL